MLFDLGLADQSLNNFDYDRIIEQAKQITGIYLYGDKNKSSCVASYMDARMGEINYIIKHGFQPICRCDNGYKVLNVDLNGKLYSCHNSRDVVGDIYQEPNKCIECNICYDRVIRRRLEICEHCPCYLMCDGGCKLISQEKLEQGYCKLRQCFWGTMLDCLSKYKEVKTE